MFRAQVFSARFSLGCHVAGSQGLMRGEALTTFWGAGNLGEVNCEKSVYNVME